MKARLATLPTPPCLGIVLEGLWGCEAKEYGSSPHEHKLQIYDGTDIYEGLGAELL